MDRIRGLVAESVQLRRDVNVMSSHFVRLMPEVAAIGRESASGCDVFATKRDVMKKPPRRNRPRSRQDGGCVSRDGVPKDPRAADDNKETFHDDDKENVCGLSRCTVTRSDGCTSQKTVANRSLSSTRLSNELIYQQCLGSVIASYLSPHRGEAAARSRLHVGRFFDTLTSAGDETPVAKPSYNDHDNDDDDGDDNNNTNTSVWLSDSALPDVDTSSGVETAASSQPEVRPGGDDVISEQVRESSRLVALCDVSRISVVSSTSVPREQLSSLGGVDVGAPSSAFHSTFNYPLHSTLRGASVRCPSPLPESPASPVRRGESEVCRRTEDRRPGLTRQRDLPPPACRRCGDATPLRRQRARARLERQRPRVHRRRQSAGRLYEDDDEVESTSVSVHATRGSLPDLSDLSSDSESYERVERRCRRRRRRSDVVDLDVEERVRRHRARTSCTHSRSHSSRPYVRRSVDPLTIFDSRRNDPVRHVDVAWSRTPSSVSRPLSRRHPAVATQRRPIGCLSNICSRRNDAAVVMATRRRPHRPGVDLACGHRRLLSKKLKLFSNILCSARSADVTQLTTLGHV